MGKLQGIGAWIVGLTLLFAVVVAPGLRPWDVGLALVPLAAALALGALTGGGEVRAGRVRLTLWLAVLGVGYAAWRASMSPIADLGRRDGLILAGGAGLMIWAACVASFRGLSIFRSWVVVAALLSTAVAAWQEWRDPLFWPLYGRRATETFPSGFASHYNHFANFAMAAGFLAAGHAVAGKGGRRILSGIAALVCLSGVALSESRGAVLASGAGLLTLIAGSWLYFLRIRSKRANLLGSVGLVAVALLVTGAWFGGGAVLKEREKATGHGLLNDSGRLENLSNAASQMQGQVLTGGGAHSFSYRVFDFWNPQERWAGSPDPDMVHNELVQTAVDYGLVGLGLTVLVLAGALTRSVLLLWLGPGNTESEAPDPTLLIGAPAAIVAMLTQSMFSFVFHVLPDVMVLGFCLGALCRSSWRDGKPAAAWRGILCRTALAGIAIGSGVLALGDARAWLKLHPLGQPVQATSRQELAQRLSAALAVRPDFLLASSLGTVEGQSIAPEPKADDPAMVAAIRDYQTAIARHPRDYATTLALARLLDRSGRFEESEALYQRLVPRMDVREPVYRTRFYYALHWSMRGDAVWMKRRPEEGLYCFLQAQENFRKSEAMGGLRRGSEETDDLELGIHDKINLLTGAGVQPATEVR